MLLMSYQIKSIQCKGHYGKVKHVRHNYVVKAVRSGTYGAGCHSPCQCHNSQSVSQVYNSCGDAIHVIAAAVPHLLIEGEERAIQYSAI